MNMKTENERNRNVLDQSFKSIIHRASILAWLLRSCVDELRDKTIDEIKQGLDIGADGIFVKGRETEQISSTNGPVVMDNIFDVRVAGTDETLSVIIDVEAQNESNPGYPLGKRAEYYIARLVSDQKGREFRNSDYGGLKKTYSIWLMMDPYEGNRNTVVKYRMIPQTIGDPKRVEDLGTMNIIFLNLGGPYGEELPEEIRFTTALFSSDLSEDYRRFILKDKYNIPTEEYPKQELDSMGLLYDDTKSRFLREGRAEGRAEGIVEEKVDTAVFLIEKKGYSIDEAIEFVDRDNTMAEELRPIIEGRLSGQ